jgi:cytoskeleton protein RodZ
MTSTGETLRRERLRRAWSLEKVAAETKITLHLLEAIESDQFDRLPGGVFARNFVRQYARMLKLDEDEVLTSFRQQFEEPAEAMAPIEPVNLNPHVPRVPPLEDFRSRLGPGSSLSAFAGLVAVMLACAGVYSWWQKPRRSPPTTQNRASTPKATPRAGIPATPDVKTAAGVPAGTPKPEFRPAEVSESGTIHAPEAQAPKLLEAAPAVSAEATPSAVRVAMTASEPVWVSIKSDGTRTFTGTLEAQQKREFDASGRMTVLVGNAGSLEILLNGNPVGPIGHRGEIRLLVLTPSGAHVVPRTPPTPPPTSDDSTSDEPAATGDRP